MDRTLAIAFALGAGVAAAMQAPVNAGVRAAIGGAQAGAVSAVGTAFIFLIAAFAIGGGFKAPAVELPVWQYLAGGALGAVYVGALLATVRTLGATGLLAAVVAGQLATSLVLDHFGAVGLERNAITPDRLAGLALLAGGATLVLRP